MRLQRTAQNATIKNSTKFANENKCTGAGSVTRVCWAARWVKGETLSSAGEVKYFWSEILAIFFHLFVIEIWFDFETFFWPARGVICNLNCFFLQLGLWTAAGKDETAGCQKCVTFWLMTNRLKIKGWPTRLLTDNCLGDCKFTAILLPILVYFNTFWNSQGVTNSVSSSRLPSPRPSPEPSGRGSPVPGNHNNTGQHSLSLIRPK